MYLYDACKAANEHPEIINHDKTQLLIELFAQYLQTTFGETLGNPDQPVFNFTGKLYDFVWNTRTFRGTVGFSFDKQGIVNGVTFFYQKYQASTVFDNIASFSAVSEWNRWELLVDYINAHSPPTLGPAFQTSDVWVRIFTEVAAVNGIQQGLAVSCAVATAGLLLFSGNIIVSFLAMIVLIMNVVFMLAFYKFMDWDIGVIEAVKIKLTFVTITKLFLIGFYYNSCWTMCRLFYSYV